MAKKPERKRKIKSIEASSRHQEENNKNYWSIKKKKTSCFLKLCWFLDKHKTWTKTTLNTCVKATLVQKPHQLFWPSILRRKKNKTFKNLRRFSSQLCEDTLLLNRGFTIPRRNLPVECSKALIELDTYSWVHPLLSWGGKTSVKFTGCRWHYKQLCGGIEILRNLEFGS